MSVSVVGQNLATIWTAQKESFGVKQTDPEVGSNSGQALSAYNQEGWPQLRRFIMSLRVTF